jgi:hypothetical protein
MKIITEISILDLKEMAKNFFGNMVKAVADIDKNLIALDAELHSDLESLLIENGSKQNDLWRINFYPDEVEDFLEFDSMINIHPSQNNFSRGVEKEDVRKIISDLVQKAIKR